MAGSGPAASLSLLETRRAGEQVLTSFEDAPAPHEFWQDLLPPGTHDPEPEAGHRDFYPAALPDGRQLLLPLRVLPGDGAKAVASLIINQASFAVEDALCDAVARLAAPLRPEIVVGVPTLGLGLANGVARRLGHVRTVALGTSRKFWYDDTFSRPIHSITSPDAAKTLYFDPRLLPLLAGRRVLLVDDVLSTGTSIAAALHLLQAAAVRPVAIAAAMLQGTRWRASVEALEPSLPVLGALQTPLLRRDQDDAFRPVSERAEAPR